MMVLDFIDKYIYIAYIIVILVIIYLLIKAISMLLKCVNKLSDNANKLTNNISTLTNQTKQIKGFVDSASNMVGNASMSLFIFSILSQLNAGRKYSNKPMKRVVVETAVKNVPKFVQLMK